VKRTYGKTKPPQQGLRRVRIFVGEQCVGFLWARSLRKALEEYNAEHMLSGHEDYGRPVYIGNTLTRLTPEGLITVTALEASS
jgi:hypothetical protein